MDYELIKWRDSGEVALRILARPRRAPLGNPIVALGFTVFARRQQLRFYDRALERTRRLVAPDADMPDGRGRTRAAR